MVVLYHYTTIFEREYGHPQPFPFHLDLGYYGVHLFFLISGFVIYMTLERTTNTRDFIISRATRLYPAYWAALALTFTVVALAGLPGREGTSLDALLNVSMLHQYVGARSVDGVYWTLTIELAFYAWMLAFWRIGLLSQPLRMLLVWLGINSLVVALAATFQIATPSAVSSALLIGYGNLFFAGIGFYLWKEHRSPASLLLITSSLVFEALLRPDSIATNIAIYALFALAISGRLRLLATRPLLYLGAISYPLYLVHQYIGYVIIRQLYASNISHPILILGIPIAIALLLAVFIHHFVEEPALHTLRQRFLRRTHPPSHVDEPSEETATLPLAS